jgi:hypothetical protein
MSDTPTVDLSLSLKEAIRLRHEAVTRTHAVASCSSDTLDELRRQEALICARAKENSTGYIHSNPDAWVRKYGNMHTHQPNQANHRNQFRSPHSMLYDDDQYGPHVHHSYDPNSHDAYDRVRARHGQHRPTHSINAAHARWEARQRHRPHDSEYGQRQRHLMDTGDVPAPYW